MAISLTAASQGLVGNIFLGAVVTCLLLTAGCRPENSSAVAPVEKTRPLELAAEGPREQSAEPIVATADVQGEQVEPSEAIEATTELRSLLRRLEQWEVKCTEVDEGYSVGLRAEHLTDDGEIHAEIFRVLQRLPRMVSLYFFRAAISDAGLEQAKTFSKLKFLSVSSPGIYGAYTDEGVAHVGDLTDLEELSLSEATNVTDAALPVIARLTKLRELYISDSTLTDAGLKQLAPLKRLEKLQLLNCENFEGRGLAFLNEVASLRFLDLHGCDATDAGLSAIQELPNLRLFGADYNERLTGSGLGFLSESKKLKDLSIDDCPKLGNAALVAAASCRELESLDLSDTGVTDEGIPSLSGLASLQTLDLRNCEHLTDDALETIGGLSRLRELTLSRTQVTDAGLRHLHGSHSLRILTLTDTRVTATGIAALKQQLPQIEIYQE